MSTPARAAQRRSRSMPPVLLATIAIGFGAPIAAEDRSLPVPVLEVYERLASSMRTEDVRAFMSAFSLDFVFEGTDGSTTDRGPWRRVWLGEFEAHDYDLVAFDVEKLHEVDADRVVADMRRVMVYRSRGSAGRRLRESLLEDVWERNDSGWQLRYQREAEVRVDGALADGVAGDDSGLASPRLAALERAASERGAAAVSEFCAAITGHAPLIEPLPGDHGGGDRLVTFVWRGEGGESAVRLTGGVPHHGPKPMRRLGETTLWHRSERVPADARFVYGFRVERGVSLPATGDRPARRVTVLVDAGDPFNPTTFGDAPAVVMPEAPEQHWIARVPDRPRGRLFRESLHSVALDEDRVVWVYAPPGRAESGREGGGASNGPAKLVVLLDGETYRSPIPVRTVLDNLHAEKRIPPTVALLVDSRGTRRRDLAYSDAFARFLATELVPWARRTLRAGARADDTVIGGVGHGAAMAAYCALEHPQVFGGAIAQSADFSLPDDRPPGWLAARIATAERAPVRFAIEAGRLDPDTLRERNRHLRDVLAARGYAVRFSEHGGTGLFAMRGTVGERLVEMVGGE